MIDIIVLLQLIEEQNWAKVKMNFNFNRSYDECLANLDKGENEFKDEMTVIISE